MVNPAVSFVPEWFLVFGIAAMVIFGFITASIASIMDPTGRRVRYPAFVLITLAFLFTAGMCTFQYKTYKDTVQYLCEQTGYCVQKDFRPRYFRRG